MNEAIQPARRAIDPRFYTFAGLGIALVVLIGFAKTYYLKLAFHTPGLQPLLHLHGLVMTCWFLLFLVQSKLVSARRVDLHKRLGMASAVVAAAVLVLGVLAAVNMARLGRSPGPPPLVFLVVPLWDMLIFGTLIGLGFAFRKRPAVHRRLMLMGSVGILDAAIARVPLDFVARGGPVAYFGVVSLIALGCMVYDWRKHGRLHPAMGWSTLFIVVSGPLRLILGGSDLWLAFARWVTA